MGKKNKSTLGRCLIKDRFSSRKPNRDHESMLHTSELNDGYDWGRLNLQSVTEQSSFEEFLSTAQLAGTEFQAEKLNITFVSPTAGVLTAEERRKFEETKEGKKDVLRIPRRPKWDDSTTPEQLDALERESFLEWRRSLAQLQDDEGLTLTPYERNLDFWRQLWRVVERSDVVVQIVDARNPLLFRCEDLEKYVKEVDEKKLNVLLVNKADFLTEKQRELWAHYFNKVGIKGVFFSALASTQEVINEEDEESSETESSPQVVEEISSVVGAQEDKSGEGAVAPLPGDSTESRVLDRKELIQLFEGLRSDCDKVTIGLVGYPNVGKSSTINALLQEKKVSVSHTPGKTKHFQTLLLNNRVTLCDCPGLVMPTMVASKADMILSGILPIDQMKDHVSPVALLTSLIPKNILEYHYSIMIPPPAEGEDPNRAPTPHEFLDPFAYSRGFMTQNGQPDASRASRIVLKDFVQGRLLYCFSPPGESQEDFHSFVVPKGKEGPAQPIPKAIRAVQTIKNIRSSDLDSAFFKSVSLGSHTKGVTKIMPNEISNEASGTSKSKPWKDHSHKRNKREKLRRVYRHLDE